MALPSSPPLPPVTEEQFLAERESFWGAFTSSITGSIVVMVVLLAGMAFFLL